MAHGHDRVDALPEQVAGVHLGADVGGVLSLVPAFGVLLLLLAAIGTGSASAARATAAPIAIADTDCAADRAEPARVVEMAITAPNGA